MKRREFLGAGATGLALAVPLQGTPRGQARAALEPSAFLRIAPDDTITIWVPQLEMGQGVRTLLPMMIAEELEADWARVRVEQAWPGGKFQGVRLHTGGSGSVTDNFMRLRRAGATAREMLIAAAARTWRVAPETCVAEASVVRHPPTRRQLRFGALTTAAARLPVPASPRLKDRAAFTLLGKPMKRFDGPAIVTGRAEYGLDRKLPGMLCASIERAPTLGGTLVRFDASAALAMPGVRRVVATTAGIHPGVAVLADDHWTAMRARAALRITWEQGTPFDSDRFIAAMPGALDRTMLPVRADGDAPAALGAAARRISATYSYPFQAHAPLETMNCTASVRDGRVEIWAPTQTDVRSLAQASKVAGVPADRITLHCALMGGGFGRRLFADYVGEAVELAKIADAPVQVLWTRQDDMRHGYFQPATVQRFTAGLDRAGGLLAVDHDTSFSDLTIYDLHDGRNIWHGPAKPAHEPNYFAENELPWGAFDNPYQFANLRVRCADVTSPVPTGPWRAVMYPSTVFGRECFLDEVARAAGKDPIAQRLELLPRDVREIGPFRIDRARLARVLEAARADAAWAPRAHDARLRGRGVAASVYHAGSYIAMIAEVSVARDLSDLKVERITTIADCGIALNPLGVEGQTESAIAWGLTATLMGKSDFTGGAAVQGSYRDYHVLRIDQMPALRTVLLDSGQNPGGYGEHPVPLVAPAVANAIFDATGKRVRDLPITPAKLASA